METLIERLKKEALYLHNFIEMLEGHPSYAGKYGDAINIALTEYASQGDDIQEIIDEIFNNHGDAILSIAE